MQCEEALHLLRQHEAKLKSLGVNGMYLFGSTARGEATSHSDIDLFVDYERGKLGLFELMDVRELAASILGVRVDITTRDGLHRMLRPQIENTAVRVF